MKNIHQLFKNKDFLLDEPEVEELIAYCEQLQDEIIEFKFEKENNKQLLMLDMLKEIVKGCNAVEKEQMEHDRFGYEAPNYQATISNLKHYILERSKDNQIYL
jgi:hypothetical protein